MMIPKSFDRNARLWGADAAGRLARSHVMVLGMGGVGSYAVEALVRAGVGRLTLVDFDEICITNVNRQLHALPSTVGGSKAELMAARARSIHPGIAVEPIHAFYEAKTSAAILGRKPDLIVDAIDNITAKLHLLATCVYRRLPVVTCLGASAKIDPTRIRYDELRKTKQDPLARTIRKNLWHVYGVNLRRVSDLVAVFSDEPVRMPDPDYRSALCGAECACPNSGNPHHTCAKRSVIHGSAVFVTSMFGMVAASLAVRFLTGVDAISLVPVVRPLPGDDPPVDPDERWRDGVLVEA